MGTNIKILAELEVEQTLYYNHECHLELRENFHDHEEDYRMVYSKEDFLAISDHWIRARKKYDELGQPEPAEQNIDLSNVVLKGQRLHHDRCAIEFTEGGASEKDGTDTIHVHYRNGRLHLTKRDFRRMAGTFSEALKSYNKHYGTIINLNDPNVIMRPIAKNEYSNWLKEYDEGKYPKENPDSFWDMFLQHKNFLRPEEIQRPNGGWLKDSPRTRNVPEEFDKRYLFTILECMKKYGYAQGPFLYDYIPAYKNQENQIELAGSHRAACLFHLGLIEIPVIITN